MNPLYLKHQTCEFSNEDQMRMCEWYYYSEIIDFEVFGLSEALWDDYWMYDKKKKGSFDGFYFQNESKLRYFG